MTNAVLQLAVHRLRHAFGTMTMSCTRRKKVRVTYSVQWICHAIGAVFMSRTRLNNFVTCTVQRLRHIHGALVKSLTRCNDYVTY